MANVQDVFETVAHKRTPCNVTSGKTLLLMLLLMVLSSVQRLNSVTRWGGLLPAGVLLSVPFHNHCRNIPSSCQEYTHTTSSSLVFVLVFVLVVVLVVAVVVALVKVKMGAMSCSAGAGPTK